MRISDWSSDVCSSDLIFGEGLPIPRHVLGERGAGNVLDPLHQRNQPFVTVGLGGGEADAAIAHHDGGDAVPARRHHFGIPRRLTAIMGVDVDEDGGEDLATGVAVIAARATVFVEREETSYERRRDWTRWCR